MRLIICAGGTAGGVYPALTTYQALRAKLGDELISLWIGGEGGMEAELVQRMNIPFSAIPAAGVHGVGLRSLPGNLARLTKGYVRSRQIVKQFDPDVLLFTGGYVGVPVALAALRRRKVLYVPDIEPALALRSLAYVSDKIALTVKDSVNYFPPSWKSRLEVTGYPVRSEFENDTKSTALDTLNLKFELPVLLVTGGSKGARSINNALLNGLTQLLPDIQVIHITGHLDWEENQQRFQEISNQAQGASWLAHYRPFPYLHDMGSALAAADLVLSRAGASVIGEYPFFGLPAILVPYPYAWHYQKVNAQWLKSRGAAVILRDEDLSSDLIPTVRGLMADPEQLKKMKESSVQLSRPNAASAIADILVEQVPDLRRKEC